MRAIGCLLAILGTLISGSMALAADINVFTGGAPKEVLTLLTPQFEKATGHKVHFTYIVPPPPSQAGTGSGYGKGLFNQFGDLRMTLPPHSAGTVSVVVVEPGFVSSPLPLTYG